MERITIDKKKTQQEKTSKTDGKRGGSIKIRNKILHGLRNLAVGTNCTTRLRRRVRVARALHYFLFYQNHTKFVKVCTTPAGSHTG